MSASSGDDGKHLRPDDIVACLSLDHDGVGRIPVAMQRHLAAREDWLRDLAQQSGLAPMLDELPASSVSRIAGAPLFGEFAAARPQQSAATKDLLAQWIRAEGCLIGRYLLPPGDHWTARGDYCLDGDGSVRFAAPSVHGVLIDGHSPYARTVPFLPPADRERARPTPDLALAADKLRGALRLIDHVRPAGAELILAALSAVITYDNPKAGFATSSSRRYPGVAAFGNACAETVSIHHIVDALLHEATHSFLYVAEIDTPFFPGRHTDTPRIRSPWTGAELPLHGFVHACCVWYELTVFWNHVLRNREESKCQEAQQLYRRAAAGFLQAELSEAIRVVRDHITVAAWRLLRDLQSRAETLVAALPLPGTRASAGAEGGYPVVHDNLLHRESPKRRRDIRFLPVAGG